MKQDHTSTPAELGSIISNAVTISSSMTSPILQGSGSCGWY